MRGLRVAAGEAPYRDPIIPDRRVRNALFSALLIALLIFGLLDVRHRATPGSGTLNDFTVYFAAGAAVRAGASIYDSPNERGWSFIYPPFFAVVMSLLVPLGREWAGFAWFLISVATAFASYFELGRIVRAVTPDERLPLPLWLASGPILAVALPGISCFQAGQVGIALLWLLLVALRLLVEARAPSSDVAAGALLAVAVAIKLTPALPAMVAVLFFVAARGQWRRTFALVSGLAAGGAATLLLVPAAVFGWNGNLQLFSRFVRQVVIERRDMFAESVANQSLWYALPRVFDHADGGSSAFSTAAPLAAILAVAFVTLLTLRERTGASDALPVCFTLAAAATLVVSPVFWVHHFVVATGALLFVPMRLWHSGREVFARLLSGGSVILAVMHYALRTFDEGLILLGLAFPVWLFVAVTAVVQTGIGRASLPAAPPS